MFDRLFGLTDDRPACACSVTIDGDVLTVDTNACPGDGELSTSPKCRATIGAALAANGASVVDTTGGGRSRRYEGDGPALLQAAGVTAIRLADRDTSLGQVVLEDPLAVVRQLRDRTDAVAKVVTETGLVASATGTDYEEIFQPFVGPSIAGSRIRPGAPKSGELVATWSLQGDGLARRYERPDRAVDSLFLEPVGSGLNAEDYQIIADAEGLLAAGSVEPDDRGPRRAVNRAATAPSTSPEKLAEVLKKHTRGVGVLEDFLAVPGLTDVFASAPIATNDVRVQVDGETLTTNVRLTATGGAALASTIRRASGRALSRASPSLDAALAVGSDDRRVRVAAITDPVSDGPGFAIRSHGHDAWTLPALVSSGTLPPDAAALLSVAVERGSSLLVAGARGAGKTTLLGALTWSVPPATRLVVIEDTPELPVGALQEQGRDVQALHTDPAEGFDTTAALHSALRLGDGALTLGEVRGSEASVLYEAMRVGATDSAVLGTIHGRDTAAVRGRVVDDLGVTPTAFGATDLIVTCAVGDDRDHHLTGIDEIIGAQPDASAALFEQSPAGLTSTGRLTRGNSHVLAQLTEPAEQYSTLLDRLDNRQEWIVNLVERNRTTAGDIRDARPSRGAAK